MWSAVAEKRAGNPVRASYCQNVRFAPGVVKTRPGTVQVLCNNQQPGKITKGLSIGNLGGGWRCYYLAGTQLRYGALNSGFINCAAPFDYTTPTLAAFPSVPVFKDTLGGTPYTISVAWFNKFAYIALSDKNGNGIAPVLISDGSAIVDVAFSAWSLYRSGLQLGGGFGMAFSQIGAGYTTPGLTNYAMVLQTGTGFLSQPMVQTGPNFVTASKVQATFTIPAGYSIYGSGTVYLLKNRVDNPTQWYWIPNDPISGTVGEVPYVPGATTLTFTINISDADMAASLDPANDQWLTLQQAVHPILTGPIKPSFVSLYGKRMCYGADNILYVSDLDSPQAITPDRNIVETPKQLKLGFAFSLQGSPDLYMTGAKWLGRVSDNGDTPSTWAPPILISETIGAPFPGCVCHRTAGGYAWLATDAGVFLFTGVLGDKPVTWMIQDQWSRVNWNAAAAIEMEDDIENRVLYVAVPLDGATEVNAVFCIDYTYGLSAEQVDISLDLYQSNGVYSVAVGPDETGANRVWLGSDQGYLLMHNEGGSATDAGGPITSIWESGLVRSPGDFASRMVRVGGMDLWMRGGGGLTTTVYSLDKQRSVSPYLLSSAGATTGLAATPGIMYHHKFDISKIENYSIRFQVNTWFELSGFTVYSKPDLYNR
jgi:hypothetical protein